MWEVLLVEAASEGVRGKKKRRRGVWVGVLAVGAMAMDAGVVLLPRDDLSHSWGRSSL